MDHNEQVYKALLAGLPVKVAASDAHGVATAMRRRLRKQEVGMLALDIKVQRKRITTAPADDPNYLVLRMVAAPIPTFEILQESNDDTTTGLPAP